MNKNSAERYIVRDTGLSIYQVRCCVDSLMAFLIKAVVAGERVEFRGFGAFSSEHRPAVRRHHAYKKIFIDHPAYYKPIVKFSHLLRVMVDESLSHGKHPGIKEEIKKLKNEKYSESIKCFQNNQPDIIWAKRNLKNSPKKMLRMVE